MIFNLVEQPVILTHQVTPCLLRKIFKIEYFRFLSEISVEILTQNSRLVGRLKLFKSKIFEFLRRKIPNL